MDPGRLTLLGDAAHPMFRISARAPTNRSKTAWHSRRFGVATRQRDVPAALLAYERLRRERVPQVQVAPVRRLRYDSAYADLAVRDAEIAPTPSFVEPFMTTMSFRLRKPRLSHLSRPDRYLLQSALHCAFPEISYFPSQFEGIKECADQVRVTGIL